MPDYNRFGEEITAVPSLRNEKWLIGFDSKGWPIADWPNNIVHGDGDGFDLDHRIDVDYELPVGTRIQRYSREGGIFSAPIGTRYECLAMPYTIDSIMYNEYEVIKPFTVKRRACFGYQVMKGIVAEGFDVIGGGVQYKHYEAISTAVRKGYLRKLEVCEWSSNPETRA